MFSTTQTHIWSNRQQTNNNSNNHNKFMVVPYTNGLSESFKKVCNKVVVQVHFKGNNNINNLAVVPKDKDTITQKSGVIYRLKCTNEGCREGYIRESGRTFGVSITFSNRPDVAMLVWMYRNLV